MAKPRNLQPQENSDNQLNESDRQVNKFNKFFSGSKSLDSVISRKLLIGLIIAFGILIFFLTTVNFDKIKTKSSFFGSQPPPPPPADVVSPSEPPDNVFDESNVYGETTASKEPPCYFTAGSTKNGYGDINGDGGVTNEDAGLTLQASTLNSIQKKAGDVNANGIVEFTGDGVMIGQYVGGAISTFPVCANLPPTPTPTPTYTRPYGLRVDFDGCPERTNGMAIFYWKPADSSVNWELDVSDNDWKTYHYTNEFRISGDETGSIWSLSEPMSEDFKPAADTLYKWRVFAGNNWADGPEFRTCKPETSPTPSPSPAPKRPPCFFTYIVDGDFVGSRGYGDVNGDGWVTMDDAKMTISDRDRLEGANKKAADIDANGIVDFVSDAVSIAKYVYGSIQTFPVCSGEPGAAAAGPVKIQSTSQEGGQVKTAVSVPSKDQGTYVWVSIYDSKSKLQSQANCQVSSGSCTTMQPTPSAKGNYKVVAVADLDRDGKWYEPGEYDVKGLSF